MLCDRIKEFREKKNLSQKELAEIIGVKTGDIAEWESGETEPNLLYLNKLTTALGISYDTLLGEDKNTNENSIESAATEHHTTVEGKAESQSISERKVEEKEKTAPKPKYKKLILIIIIVFIILAIGLSLYFFVFRSTSFSKNTNEISKAENSVVKICCYGIDGNESATGSGFVYNNDKTIITNYHVMTEAYTCKISTNKDISYVVEKIVAYSKEKDVAVLSLKKSTGLMPLTLGDSDSINKGETVTAIGSPLGIKNMVSGGVLSGRIPEKNMEVLQFTASISSGSSGGALFNEKGEVIGITYASYVEGQNLNLAIPINEANNVYNTKKKESSVNAICVIEHPYFNSNNENIFKEAEKVTLSQLSSNPENYFSNHESLTFDATVSSISDGEYIYVYTDNSVSNNFEYDNSSFESNDFENNHLIRIDIKNTKTENIDKEIVPGDKIRVIVPRFFYCKKGELDDFGEEIKTVDEIIKIMNKIKNGEGEQYIAKLNRAGCHGNIIYKLK